MKRRLKWSVHTVGLALAWDSFGNYMSTEQESAVKITKKWGCIRSGCIFLLVNPTPFFLINEGCFFLSNCHCTTKQWQSSSEASSGYAPWLVWRFFWSKGGTDKHIQIFTSSLNTCVMCNPKTYACSHLIHNIQRICFYFLHNLLSKWWKI